MVDALQAENQLVWFEPFSPVIDGEEFTQGPFEYFQQGKWEGNKRNLIFGTNVDEMFGAAFLFSPGVPVNNDTFEVRVMFVIMESSIANNSMGRSSKL